MTEETTWSVADLERTERLDRYLAARFALPRNQVQRWIRAGLVSVDGVPAKASTTLTGGERIVCHRPPPPAAEIEPEEGELRLLYEDAHVVVIDKPAGLVVHPGAGRSRGTLAHRLLGRYPEMNGVGGPGRPGIVHRLDKGTSGALVAARTAAAHRRLSRDFAARRVEKTYLAVVYGAPRAPRGIVRAPIGRHPRQRKRMTVRPQGRPAESSYRIVASAAGISLLTVAIATGRTHQIRVHLESIGDPLVGDPVYGGARSKGIAGAAGRALGHFPRPALHAWRLAFPHPGSGEWLAVEAPVPGDLRALWHEVTGLPWPDPAPSAGARDPHPQRSSPSSR